MKIEITNEGEHFNFYKQGESRPLKNMRSNFKPFAFYEDDVLNLIGEANYKKFEQGKYIFDVTASHLKLVTGERSAQTRSELTMYKD